MANTKGNSIVWLREYINKHHANQKKVFIDSLDSEEKNILSLTLSITWLPVTKVARIVEKAANIIYPNDKLGLRKLGRSQCEEQFSGIYNFFLKFISIQKLINQAARIWRVYHDSGGTLIVRTDGPKELTMVLTNYVDYPDAYGENTCGFIEKLVEKAGKKNPIVAYHRVNPMRCEWSIKL